MNLEVELAELRRLARLRRLLEVPARIHETITPECKGECENPTHIGTLGLICCHMQLARDYYADLHKLEKHLRKRVKNGRNELRYLDVHSLRKVQASELELGQTYPRAFTGTYIMRTLKGWVFKRGKGVEDDDAESQASTPPQRATKET